MEWRLFCVSGHAKGVKGVKAIDAAIAMPLMGLTRARGRASNPDSRAPTTGDIMRARGYSPRDALRWCISVKGFWV